MPAISILSKSTFVRGCKCLKSLYLYKFHYNLRDEISEQQQAVFNNGNEAGMLARNLFPEGKDASVNPAYRYLDSVKLTEQIFHRGTKIIYEAGFVFNNIYAAIDILEIRNNGWYLYEVKSSTSVKDYYLLDVALQYYILKNLGYPVKQINIVYINKEYVRYGEVEPKKLFTIQDVTAEAINLQNFVQNQLEEMQQLLKTGKEPQCRLGSQCSNFYSCDFQNYCWKKVHEAEYPVNKISKIGDKLWELLNKDIFCQSQIDDDFFFKKLTPGQRQQIFCTLEKKSSQPNIKEIKKFLKEIVEPVSFLDFETIFPTIPLFDNSRPYQQITFQFSLHCDDVSNKYCHYEFLGDGKTDPRPELIKQLLAALPKKGSVFVYYMPFEKARLEELARDFPQYKKQLLSICNRLIDLIIPFRNRYVYHYKMNGSASIKSVLPALFPEFDYANLNIGDGGMASRSYLNLSCLTNKNEITVIRENLLEYCKMDTLAMIKLYEYLKELIPKPAKMISLWESVSPDFKPVLSNF